MITVSNGFKESISKTEREMKGYVEVSYTNSDIKQDTTIADFPTPLKIGADYISSSAIIDDDRIGKNYASLEQDYFMLDGTFLLPNNIADKNTGIGYVSSKTFEDDSSIPSTPFVITTYPVGNSSGLTMYFKNNKPLDLEVEVTSNGNAETFTINDMIIQENGTVILPFTNRAINRIDIYVKDVLYQNRRIRLQEIDFGLSSIYEGEDLIRFKTTEQCNRFGDEMPINECEVVLGDYQDDFDTINPKGIAEYLTSNVMIKPYVGVVTEENGIEYCPQGWYWLDTWKKTEDDVTLNGKGFANKLLNTIYPKFYDGLTYYYQTIENMKLVFWYNHNVNVPSNGAPQPYDNYYTLGSGIETIQREKSYYANAVVEAKNQTDEEYAITGYDYDYLFKALYYKSDGIIKKTINADTLTKYQEITDNPPIRSISVKEYQYPSYESVNEILYETTLVCDGEETLVYDYGKPIGTKTYIICNDYSSLQIIDARNHIYDSNDNLIYTPTYGGNLLTYSYAKIRYSGTLTFKILAQTEYKEEIYENIVKLGTEGVAIELNDNYIGGSNSRSCSNAYINSRIEAYNKHSTKFSYNGDPSVELGDNIEVESKFKDNGNTQYDLVWVTKIESEFDGSFNQTIEGDILE